ncbi:hypothetical protein L1053_23675, partial [Escherichia coli]|nr:hypothetical protein [Escherichia coli]
MINKIDFKAKNLTSNAGLFLLLENAKSNGIFDFIENDLVFDNDSTNKIKMNHIKTMLCGHFIGIDKLEGTVAKLAMRQPFVLFKGLTFQKLCLPGAFRPGDHHNKMLRPG